MHKMPGHAGFSYGFRAFARLDRELVPAPSAAERAVGGTADVLRQVAALRALDGGPVPHCTVKWAGEELEFFGRPYFVVPKLEGDVLLIGPGAGRTRSRRRRGARWGRRR